MAANRKPRKRYRPRPLDIDPMGLAMTTAAALTPRQRGTLAANATTAFDAFRVGAGSLEHWQSLAGIISVAEQLARAGIARDHVETFSGARQMLVEVWQRHATRQSWTLYPREITTLDDALWLYGVQLQHVSQRELSEARDTVERRWTQALLGNAAEGCMVVGGGGVRLA